MQYVCSNCGLWFSSDDIVAQHARESFCRSYRRQSASESDGSCTSVDHRQNTRQAKKMRHSLDSVRIDDSAESPPTTKRARHHAGDSTGPSSVSQEAGGDAGARRSPRGKSIIPIGNDTLPRGHSCIAWAPWSIHSYDSIHHHISLFCTFFGYREKGPLCDLLCVSRQDIYHGHCQGP